MRSFAVVFVTLTFALFILGGCSGGGQGGGLRVLGRVLDDGSQQPIPGAHVVANNGARATTNAAGQFDLAGAPAGGSVTVTAAGYLNNVTALAAAGVLLDLGDVFAVPAPVGGAGRIIGTITRANGTPAVAAVVRAADREAVTRANGTYTLYNVPAGFQRVYATAADGATSGSTNVTVMSQFESIANVQLGIAPPPPM